MPNRPSAHPVQRPFSSLLVGLVGTAALVLGGCAAEAGEPGSSGERRLGSQSSAIQGGTADTSAKHNFAVGVANRLGGVCSGTLIAPNLVLTARHCVVPPVKDETVTCANRFADDVTPDDLFITTEPNLYKAKSYYAASQVITPDDKAFCGNDIALIVLANAVPAAEAQPATPVVQFEITNKRLSGEITAMGYGITSPSAADSGQRRIRENIPLLCIPGDATMDCTGSNAKLSDDHGEFVTKGYVCSGDSGSGAFDQKSFDAGGTPYVLGALSRGPQTADECLAAIYSRTDAHKDLIVGAGILAAKQGNYPAPAWTAATPADAVGDDPVADGTGSTTCAGSVCTNTSATEPAPSGAPASATPASAGSAGGCMAAPAGPGAPGTMSFVVGLALAALARSSRRRRHGAG